MKLGILREWLSWIPTNPEDDDNDDVNTENTDNNNNDNDNTTTTSTTPEKFTPTKKLCERDYIILDMLNSSPSDTVSYCITDPHQSDNPVIFISRGFTKLTGWEYTDIVGKNCRFLQGKDTADTDVNKIRTALKNEVECSVNLLNYKKDGSTFVNEFFLTQLRTPGQELAYFIGIQAAVPHEGPGQMPSNPGWVYTLGNHV